jgi:hypothetical protein
MNAGSKISDNTNSSLGGGVSVASGAFTMNGGTITGNTAGNLGQGGGVRVTASGIFNKTGGTVTGNTPNNVRDATRVCSH